MLLRARNDRSRQDANTSAPSVSISGDGTNASELHIPSSQDTVISGLDNDCTPVLVDPSVASNLFESFRSLGEDEMSLAMKLKPSKHGAAGLRSMKGGCVRSQAERESARSSKQMRSKERSNSPHRASKKTAKVIPDGRNCRICGCKDNDRDLVNPEEFMRWGYQPLGRKNSGRVCWYDKTAHLARTAHKMSLTELGKECGRCSETSERQKTYRDCLVAQQKLDPDSHPNWPKDNEDPQEKLEEVDEDELALVDKDPCMRYEAYKAKYGDPSLNGMNHRRETIKGVDVVIMPGDGMMELQRVKRQKVAKTKVVDDGSKLVGEDQILEKYEHIALTLNLEATGVSYQDMLGVEATSNSPEFEGIDGSVKEPEEESDDASDAEARESERKRQKVGFAFGSGSPGVIPARQVIPAASGSPGLIPARQVIPAGLVTPKATGSATPKTKHTARSANAKAKQKTGRGKTGRPTDHLANVLIFCNEFAEASPTEPKYFGEEVRNNLRTLCKCLKATTDKAEGATGDDKDELDLAMKQLSTIDALVKAARNHGGFDTAEFYKVYDEKIRFLKLKPEAQLEIPEFVVKGRFCFGVVNWAAIEDLPHMLGPDQLMDAGYEKDEHEEIQIKLLAHRFATVCYCSEDGPLKPAEIKERQDTLSREVDVTADNAHIWCEGYFAWVQLLGLRMLLRGMPAPSWKAGTAPPERLLPADWESEIGAMNLEELLDGCKNDTNAILNVVRINQTLTHEFLRLANDVVRRQKLHKRLSREYEHIFATFSASAGEFCQALEDGSWRCEEAKSVEAWLKKLDQYLTGHSELPIAILAQVEALL